MERRPLALRRLVDEAEHLRAARLVDARLRPQLPHGVQHAQDPHGGDVGGVLGHLEGDLHVALGRQVVDLVRPHALQRPDQAVLVHQVPVMENEVLADVVDPPGVEGAAAPHQAVDLVALLEQELGEVAAVLAGDAGDEGLASRHSTSAWDRERATLHRVETGPKLPALRPRLNVGLRRRGAGWGKGKGPQNPRPALGAVRPTRPLDRMSPPPPTWLPPNPVERRGRPRRQKRRAPAMRSLVQPLLKQGPCHGARISQGIHNQGCIRFDTVTTGFGSARNTT